MLRRVGADEDNSKVKPPETNEPYHPRNYLETRWDVNNPSASIGSPPQKRFTTQSSDALVWETHDDVLKLVKYTS